MLDDYQHKFYNHLIERSRQIVKNDFEMAREIVDWKEKMLNGWHHIEVKRISVPDPTRKVLGLGDNFIAELELKLNGFNAEDIGLEIPFGQKERDTVTNIVYKEEMKLVDSVNGIAKFTCRIPMENIGVYHYAFRLFPKHKWLAHRQDFNLIKWI